MIDLSFPNYEFRIKNRHNKKYIFDQIRKKFVLLTSEEWVRQNCIMFLINVQKIPKGLINVEKKLKINNLTKRYDIIVYKSNGSVFLLVECKSLLLSNVKTFYIPLSKTITNKPLNNSQPNIPLQKTNTPILCYVFHWY